MSPSNAPLFGELAVEHGFATEEEVRLALESQEDGRPVGAILHSMGTMTPEQIEDVLMAQESTTRTIPKADPVAPPEDAPTAWLIEENGKAHPLTGETRIGRDENATLRIEDPSCSREHATIEEGILKDLGKDNGTFVNGKKLDEPHALQSGDLIQVGTTLLRYVSAAEKKVPGPSRLKNLNIQRKAVGVAAVIGMIATFFPWSHAVDGTWFLGAGGVLGWCTFLIFGAAIGAGFAGDSAKPFGRGAFYGALGLALVAFVLAFGKLVVLAGDSSWSAGFGVYLVLMASLLLGSVAFIWRPNDEGKQSLSVGLGRVGNRLSKLARDVSGKRAKEKAALVEKRDGLLLKLGEAAEDDESVKKAREKRDEAKQVLEAAESDTDKVSARNKLKAAESRLERAVKKLGRSVADDEVKVLDEQIEELS